MGENIQSTVDFLGVYTWKNKAGKSWTLYPSDQVDELTVGTDCDYYACAQGPGHWIAKFTFAGVYGPGDEMYHRKGDSTIPLILSQEKSRKLAQNHK